MADGEMSSIILIEEGCCMKKYIKIVCVCVILLFASSAFAGQWVWKPMSINGKKGDIVITTGEGFIMDLLSMLGAYYSHCGMLIDDGYTIRHNTMYANEIPIEYNYIWFIKTTPKRLNPFKLSNGMPGIITEDINTAYNGNPDHVMFKAAGGAVVKPVDALESAYRGYLNAAANVITNLAAYYRVNAYVNMFQLDNVNYYIAGRGNHCSGTVWHANYFAGKPMNVAYIPVNITAVCAESLYTSIINMVRDDAGGFGSFILDLEGFFGTGGDERIANQICNTFAFDRSTDTSSYWRGRVPAATANAPDHNLMSTYTNPAGHNMGVQTETSSYYGKVEPLVITNGYYYWVE